MIRRGRGLRKDDLEQSSRFEGKDHLVTVGGLEFKLLKDAGSTLTVTCRTCSVAKAALSGVALHAFYLEHVGAHTAPPPAPTLDLEQLVERVRALKGDELEVLALVVDGLERGLKVYGQLVVNGDARDFEAEALQEVRDAAIYAAAGIVRRRRLALAGATP